MIRRMRRRVKTYRKKKHTRKTRRQAVKSKPPKILSNYSPISSPGSNNSLVLSPSPLASPKTPITSRAEELGRLYPNTRSMIERSRSFGNESMSTENFYTAFEREFPHGNNYYNRVVR